MGTWGQDFVVHRHKQMPKKLPIWTDGEKKSNTKWYAQGNMKKKMGRWVQPKSEARSSSIMLGEAPCTGPDVILQVSLSFSLGVHPLSRDRTESDFPPPRKVPGIMVGQLLPNSILSSLQAVLWRWSELGRLLDHCSPWTTTALWPLWLLLPPAEGAEAGWEGWNHKKRGKLKGKVPKDLNQHTSLSFFCLAWC